MDSEYTSPRITGNDIPVEIWRLVATYIPDTTLQSLISVNTTFFHLALDMKYGTLTWTVLNKHFVKELGRLQSPIIASHVRILHIRAWFIAYLFKRDALFLSNTPFTAKLSNTLCSTFPQLKPLLHVEDPNLEPSIDDLELSLQLSGENNGKEKLFPTQRILHFIGTAVQGMLNVTKFWFEWTDLPVNRDTRNLLTVFRKTFNRNIQSLVLHAPITKLKELLDIEAFPSLGELDLHFDDIPDSGSVSASRNIGHVKEEEYESQGLMDTVVPFIILHKSSLRSLIISSSSKVDLSHFFCSLPYIRGLRQFEVRISFEKRQLSSPTGLLDFLDRHPSLQRVLFISNDPSNQIPPEIDLHLRRYKAQHPVVSVCPPDYDLMWLAT